MAFLHCMSVSDNAENFRSLGGTDILVALLVICWQFICQVSELAYEQ